MANFAMLSILLVTLSGTCFGAATIKHVVRRESPVGQHDQIEVAESTSMVEREDQVDDVCEYDFTMGNESSLGGCPTSAETLVTNDGICKMAAEELGAHSDNGFLKISALDAVKKRQNPRACYMANCEHNTAHREKKCFYYNAVLDDGSQQNETEIADLATTNSDPKISVCRRPKYRDGTTFTGIPPTDDATKSFDTTKKNADGSAYTTLFDSGCGSEYEIILDKTECERYAGCMQSASCQAPSGFLIGRSPRINASKHMDYPLGCFKNTRDRPDEQSPGPCVFFNDPELYKTDPDNMVVDTATGTKSLKAEIASATGMGNPTRPVGVPICKIKSSVKNNWGLHAIEDKSSTDATAEATAAAAAATSSPPPAAAADDTPADGK